MQLCANYLYRIGIVYVGIIYVGCLGFMAYQPL